MSRRIQRLNDRIKFIGTQALTEDASAGIMIKSVEIKAETYGTFIEINENQLPGVIEEAKYSLAKNLAESMIENNIVQFIINDNVGPFDRKCIGAKLFVVPWEKMVKQGSVIIRRFMNSGY